MILFLNSKSIFRHHAIWPVITGILYKQDRFAGADDLCLIGDDLVDRLNEGAPDFLGSKRERLAGRVPTVDPKAYLQEKIKDTSHLFSLTDSGSDAKFDTMKPSSKTRALLCYDAEWTE